MSEKNELTELVAKTLAQLEAMGYSIATVKGFRQKYDGLITYCTEKSITVYSETIGQEYLNYISRTRTMIERAEMAFQRTIAQLNCTLRGEQWKPVGKKLKPYTKSVFNEVVYGYEQYLRDKKTFDYRWRTRLVSRFLKQAEQLGCIELERLDIRLIYEIFIGGTLNPEYYQRVIKPFLKYAHTYELIGENLALVCPTKKRRIKVPSVYSAEDVERILAAYDRKSALGKRNYAIALIAARLGLRAGDIAKLKFENINLESLTVRIVQSKTQKPHKLPMSDDIAAVLRDYINTARPDTKDDHIFQQKYGTGPIGPGMVGRIVHGAFVAAGIECANRTSGPQALRASLANALLNEGNDYTIVRDVLGHRDIQTAKFYVKTEIEKLRNCTVPVPPASYGFAEHLRAKEGGANE